MKARRFILGGLITLFLVGSACTTDTSDNDLYEVGVRKIDITKKGEKTSVRKKHVTKGPVRN